MAGLGAAIMGLTIDQLEIPVVYTLLVGAFVIVTALHVPPVRVSTDISFGVYLFHAPVIQLSVLLGLYRGDWIGLAATAALVMSLAFLAERYIETPGIALGHRLARRPASASKVHPYAP
jgi:peptidoglycan/LPS O-acetylase OafA/YrhL